MENNLFYLIAFQRSGTTLLCHLLDKHREIVCIEEPEVSKRIVYRQYDLLRDVNFDSIKKSLDFYQVSTQQYLELVEEYLNNHLDHDLFLRSCYHLFNKKVAKIEGAKEVCELTSYKYDYIRKLISFHKGKAKFIFIERDIKGVVNSFMKLGFFPPGKRRITNFNFKRFAKKYIECLNYTERNLPQEMTHHLTYEDLILQPEKTLREIFRFLEVDLSLSTVEAILNTPSRGMRQVYSGLKREISLEWQKKLSKKQIVWLNNLYSNKRLRESKI